LIFSFFKKTYNNNDLQVYYNLQAITMQ